MEFSLDEKLILALKATAVVYKGCDPKLPSVVGSIAYFLEFPDKAQKTITAHEEVRKKERRVF